MNILALDPAIRRIGWACISVGMRAPDFGVLELPPVRNGDHAPVMAKARDFLMETFEREEIDYLIYEAPFASKDPVYYRTISAIDGAIELTCHDHGVECREVFPQKWRKRILGFTQAPKDIKGPDKRRKWIKNAAIEHCRKKGIPVRNDDEGDACCILAYKLALDDSTSDFSNLPLGGT